MSDVALFMLRKAQHKQHSIAPPRRGVAFVSYLTQLPIQLTFSRYALGSELRSVGAKKDAIKRV